MILFYLFIIYFYYFLLFIYFFYIYHDLVHLFLFFLRERFARKLKSKRMNDYRRIIYHDSIFIHYYYFTILFLIYPHVRSHSTTANFREFLARTQRVGIRAQLQSRVAAEINSHRDNSRGQGLVASYYRRGEAARRWRPINNLLFSETGEESVGPL